MNMYITISIGVEFEEGQSICEIHEDLEICMHSLSTK